jgi:tetratricopeptide (TPR) repeat protein
LTISEALAEAIQRHQAGQYQAAEEIYRRILQVEPNHAQTIHLLGLMAHQVGRHELAVDLIQRKSKGVRPCLLSLNTLPKLRSQWCMVHAPKSTH